MVESDGFGSVVGAVATVVDSDDSGAIDSVGTSDLADAASLVQRPVDIPLLVVYGELLLLAVYELLRLLADELTALVADAGLVTLREGSVQIAYFGYY